MFSDSVVYPLGLVALRGAVIGDSRVGLAIAAERHGAVAQAFYLAYAADIGHIEPVARQVLEAGGMSLVEMAYASTYGARINLVAYNRYAPAVEALEVRQPSRLRLGRVEGEAQESTLLAAVAENLVVYAPTVALGLGGIVVEFHRIACDCEGDGIVTCRLPEFIAHARYQQTVGKEHNACIREMTPHNSHSLRELGVEQSLAADKIYIFNIFAYSLAEHCSIALKLVERLEHLGSQGAIVRATLAIEVAIVAENKLQPQRLAAMSQGRIDKIADFFENSVHYPAKIRISERNAKFI